jgi:VWFA-related protein
MIRSRLLILAAGGMLMASPQERFTSRAEAVRVDVLVTMGNKPVKGLGADAFEVLDSGVAQRVEQIEIERLPLNLVLVFDTSASVAGPRLQSLRDAGRALLDVLRDGDRVALVAFATRIRLLVPLTPARDPIRAGFDGLSGAGSTSLRDAAFAGLALREADPGRTLVLLFSDGADTSSWLTAAKVIEAAKRTDVVVYPVGFRRAAGRSLPNLPGPERFLESLARETGGRVMLAGGDADLRATFLDTLAEFRDRYVLSYNAVGVPSSGWHPIEVRLKGARGKVTARRGYFVE